MLPVFYLMYGPPDFSAQPFKCATLALFRPPQNEGHDQVMARYLNPDLLILDDMGIKQLPKRSGEFLFEIIMRRHQLRSTVMTSNPPFAGLGQTRGRRTIGHSHP